MRVLLSLACASVMVVARAEAQTNSDPAVTFSKDIAPILQRSCQSCHRPDSIAPMSLLTYQEVRPYAREIKRRTGLVNTFGARGAMPPWFLEKNIGIQKFRGDYSLSDAEIQKIAAWVDNGAPEGNPADAPPPLVFADPKTWTLGKPDLIISSPTLFVKGIGPDWWGDLGLSEPSPLNENRYISSLEWKEVSDVKKPKGTGGLGLYVFHHAGASIHGEGDSGSEEGQGGLTTHEVGRNGDFYPLESGRFLPSRARLSYNVHVHPSGVAGTDRNARLDIGFRLHPKGYEPKYKVQAASFGRTEIEVNPGESNQRIDAYMVVDRPLKVMNFEPHMHAAGMRMCIEAIYGRVVETLNCAGYDHNWVRNYQYDDSAAPLLPKGTILHAIGWFDNTPKNANILDPRNLATYGSRSSANMFIVFNKGAYLTDEQFQAEVEQRREMLKVTHGEPIGCPTCYVERAPQAVASSQGAK